MNNVQKKIKKIIKLTLKAGHATPAPPVGPVLGQYGINLMNFCKEFNSRTSNDQGFPIPAVITVYTDKSFTFILKAPPVAALLLKYAGIKQGSKTPNVQIVGFITHLQLLEIAKIKALEFNTRDITKMCLIILGTARNMGIQLQ